MMSTSPDPRAALAAFLPDAADASIIPLGHGHIHDTYRIIRTGSPDLVLQRVNTHVFPDPELICQNMARVTTHLRAKGSFPFTLKTRPSLGGSELERCDAGSAWRVFDYIGGSVTREQVQSTEDAWAAGHAFAQFQRDLLDLPGPRLHEPIPHFHDGGLRFAAFLKVLREAQSHSHALCQAAQEDINYALSWEQDAGLLASLVRSGELPERVCHNDAKINNLLFQEMTGRPLAVVDLDLVMPGSALYDFGDLVRTSTGTAAEDEPDTSRMRCRADLYLALADGYLQVMGKHLTPRERSLMAFAGAAITFVIGLRFLTDYLDGDRYFKIQRPGHNLDRARAQFALARDIIRQRPELDRVSTAYGSAGRCCR